MNDLICILDHHAGAIQAIAALVTAGLTIWLIIATRRYVGIANDSLCLSREEFAEMTRVDVLLRMDVVPRTMTENEAEIALVNLSNRGIWWEKITVTFTAAKNQTVSRPVEVQVEKLVPAYSSESVPGVGTFYQAFRTTGILDAEPWGRLKIVAVGKGRGKEFTATYESPEVVLAPNSIYLPNAGNLPLGI